MQVIADDDLDGIELVDDRFDQTDAVEVDDGFLDEYSAHGICVEDEGVINWGSSVNDIRYKNPYTDTNWTEDESEELWNHEAYDVGRSFKFAGNVISLKERLHSIALAQRDGASTGSMGRR